MSIKYSVVVPLKNEEENIQELVEEVEAVMKAQNVTWEMICVDDGSTDRTLETLAGLRQVKPYLRTVVFTKNFGQSCAFAAGFNTARGKYVVTLDGDRQNDPRDIPKLMAIETDYDLVCGIRQHRMDSILKKTISFVANSVRSRVCHDGIADTGCSLKLYRRECLQNIKMYLGMHRFLPALFQIEGYRVGQIPVRHRKRIKGDTKYSLVNRSFNTIADMFAVRWMRKRKLTYEVKKIIE